MAKYDAMGDKVQRRVPVAVWIMLIGLIIGTVGLVWCLNTDLKKYVKTESLDTVQTLNEVKDLELTFDAATTSISRSSDDKIHVTIDNAPKDVYSFGKKDGKFYIKTNKFTSFIRWSGISHIPFLKDIYPQAKITVELPDTAFEKVKINNGGGDLTVSGINCSELEIDNGVGELTISSCTAEKTDIDNGVGKISASDCSFGKTEMDNGVGEIDLDDCKLSDSELDNGVGEINVKAEIKGDIDVDNGVGEINIKLKGDAGDYKFKGDDEGVKIVGEKDPDDAKYKVDLDNGIGDITVEFV